MSSALDVVVVMGAVSWCVLEILQALSLRARHHSVVSDDPTHGNFGPFFF